MSTSGRIQISIWAALSMIGRYARLRFCEQLKAVSFIVLYLVGFQLLVLGSMPSHAWHIAAGIGMVVLGLTMFLEGLIIGLMPLGERVGLKLPQRAGLAVIVFFGLLLGLGSTLAEPAVMSLRAMGGFVKAWDAPLLYSILENDPGKLVVAIGAGVGVAVAVGMVRLYFALSIKPFVYVLVPLLLAVSLYYSRDANLVALLGLAWDAGAVTTGAVTVPLVLALGIGVSRAIDRQDGGTGGFGIIMLASAFPVLGVLVLGMLLNPNVPQAMSEAEFFASHNRQEVMRVFPSEQALVRHAYQRGSSAARRACYRDDAGYRSALLSLADPTARRALLGEMSLDNWLRERASEDERALLARVSIQPEAGRSASGSFLPGLLAGQAAGAFRSVVPLTLLLLIVLLLFLRDRLRHNDEFLLGVVLSLVGMAVLTTGIQAGLAALGDEVGRSLPRVFHAEAREESRRILQPFDPDGVVNVYDQSGHPESVFFLRDQSGKMHGEPYDPARYDPATSSYEHIVRSRPVFSAKLTFAGIALVFLFAFGLGYGSTLAEPALSALGRKVEEISVGTVKRTGVVRAVSIGVGLGLLAGVARILYDLPTLWLLAPPYLLLLWLTFLSEEEFAGIAWDCGGVTTGVVTVPLVMAMGLGIGGELNVVDGFGALALASVYPIVTVMIYGLILRSRQRRSMQAAEEEQDE
ncbi:MAG: DUF1538 family protein [Kiritimatiellia bacterium]|nr:DUF1538 domain-containing protein [Lentisphaerota bacterium]